MDEKDPLDYDPHGHFRDLCMLYGDSNRPVFLNEIREWFIRGANKQELSEIRKAVGARAKGLRGGGKRGRPRARDDENFLIRARLTAWRRVVLRWTWKQIVREAGLKATKPNERTVQRRVDYLAAMIWRALPDARLAEDAERLRKILELKPIQDLLRFEVGLPFRDHPEECKKIVLELAPRGLKASAEITARLVRTVTRNREK
jgi:hypothetical protein